MENYTLNPKHIKLIKIDSKTTLFYHVETMQIYPINDIELIAFIELFISHGANGILNYYGKENVDLVKKNINKAIASAPKSTLVAFDKNEPLEYNTIVLPIVSDCNLNCPYCFAHAENGYNFGNFTNEDIVKTLEFVVGENKLRNKKSYSLIFLVGNHC